MFSPDDPRHRLRLELGPDEHIVWSGRPDPIATMLGQYPAALFGLVWTVFSLNGFVSLAQSGQTLGALMLLGFVAIGVALLMMPVIAYRKASGTAVAITPTRLLMLMDRGRTVRSVQLSAIRQVERVTKWRWTTLRIPTALISDKDGGQTVDYTSLHGMPDAETAFRLLTRRD